MRQVRSVSHTFRIGGMMKSSTGLRTDYIGSCRFALSFRVLKRYVYYSPTPAVCPKRWTLSSAGGPCLSGVSWSALLKLASVISNVARRGVNGFRSFCQNKRASAVGMNSSSSELQPTYFIHKNYSPSLPRNARLGVPVFGNKNSVKILFSQ